MSYQHGLRLAIQSKPLALPAHPTIDSPSDRLELTGVGQLIESIGTPVPTRRQCRVFGLLEPLRIQHQIESQRLATGQVIFLASHLDQPTTTVLPTVARRAIAHAFSIDNIGNLY